MGTKKYFEFELYRLNIIRGETLLFDQHLKPIKSDGDIIKILKKSVDPKYKEISSGEANTYEWVLRDFCKLNVGKEYGDIFSIAIAKAHSEITAEVVTESGLEEGRTELTPHVAQSCRLFFYMKRHLLAIEKRSVITSSERWRSALSAILKQVAFDIEHNDWIEFEPIPRKEEIFELFNSFDRLTRLKITLRRPNPELSRFAESLYRQMEEGGVREYMQDMKNPQGLKREKGKLPHASTEIASSGYKKGEVLFEGVKNGKKETAKTGKNASVGSTRVLKEDVKGIKEICTTKKASATTKAILEEIDRIAPNPEAK